ncbi:transcription factor SPEECHLESS-like [Macadamia integrifolia]|uniref:transcription factor SPEECHLESS-like n=1 Tax=Macadamia integrifolia TaxID=60698 RepID=UPI001C5328AD|nr:transcription factor SPEECHLESS-like [Macadamia integrifolia]
MGEDDGRFPNLFDESEFGDPNQLTRAASPVDLFTILETLENASDFDSLTSLDETTVLLSPKEAGEQAEASHAHKRQKLSRLVIEKAVTNSLHPMNGGSHMETIPMWEENPDSNPNGQQRMFHITVERNRRKQMNKNLLLLRSLVPSFYLKRVDQASIIGGVVDYIDELQQILQSLEAKKQRKVYSEVLSPRLVSVGPRPSPLSPRKPSPSPLSPRLSLPISPRTPQPGSPYLPKSSPSSSLDNMNELAANSKSTIAEVEVKFSGPNVLLKTISPRIPGQAVKIVAALEGLALEILHVSINTVDDTMLNSFTIKIGIECELSAEELANEIQQTFC